MVCRVVLVTYKVSRRPPTHLDTYIRLVGIYIHIYRVGRKSMP